MAIKQENVFTGSVNSDDEGKQFEHQNLPCQKDLAMQLRVVRSASVFACGFAAVLGILLCGSPVRAQTAYYFDANGATSGFGSPSGAYNASGSYWTTDSSGSSPTGQLANNAVLTFGASGSDLAGCTFTVNLDSPVSGWNGLAINSSNANVTLATDAQGAYAWMPLVGANPGRSPQARRLPTT